MTIEEFENIGACESEVLYHGKNYEIADWDSEEKLLLIAYWDEKCDDEDYVPEVKWIRYENCEIINK